MGGKKINLVGKRFGMLAVIDFSDVSLDNHHTSFVCRCDCGNKTVVRGDSLRRGDTTSCGCLLSLGNGTTHGLHKSRTYSSWNAMMNRCTNPDHDKFRYWGGRGITVCERWYKFVNFYEDMGERPVGKTLDRINPDGNYEPGNCRWATPLQQRHNRSQRSSA